MLQYSTSLSSQLTRGQGAALVTRFQTYGEGIQQVGIFEKDAKDHSASWMVFGRENGYGNGDNPVLVTGTYKTTFAWGTWHTTGSVHANCGPQLRSPIFYTNRGLNAL